MALKTRESAPLLRRTSHGLYCEAGGFYIDPWAPVETAVLTHGHSDHAREGSQHYYTSREGLAIVQSRVGDPEKNKITALEYGQPIGIGDVRVSLHPAGHILGSAQVRLEHRSEVWVVSGDFKRQPDPTCQPFEVVACDVWISESTFALPVYRWDSAARVAREIAEWTHDCAARGKTAVLGCYALGKAQRLAAELMPFLEAPIYTHGAVENLMQVYRAAGVVLPPTYPVKQIKEVPQGALVLAPPSALHSPWADKLGKIETGFASGWMAVRGNRRRRGYDRGFVLSDHADWEGVVRTAEETGANRMYFTHGFAETAARYFSEKGKQAETLQTLFEGEIEF